ncbi:uncharacterized protein LOC122647972 [Telopea speciosissima]|uniref:uncharacterized protein LOC122647972 n=1 Tax=Telopea speciosissima TaxID=54955 RepID=UPI001CC5F73D|nr:uncharacterized protein LOC122647972 [Telopea speciosissima]
MEEIKEGRQRDLKFTLTLSGVLMFRGRLCVPAVDILKDLVLKEVHQSLVSIHPGSTKMCKDLKQYLWWYGMKNDVAAFVSKCLTCQKVKAIRHRPGGLLQPLSIPEWKWEQITMDFVTGLPRTKKGMDTIWVVVDRLTKTAHFIPMKITYSMDKLAKLYVDNIVRLHGVPVDIVSYRDSRFTSRFWKSLQSAMELVQSTCEKVDLIKEKIRVAQSRQKSYADRRRQHLQFNVGEKAFLKVSPTKGVVCFGKRGKLNPRYIGPFEFLAKVGAVAYKLALPPSLAGVHHVFHVSVLRQYIPDSTHLLPQQPAELVADLTYEEVPEKILDKKKHNLRSRTISFVKVKWSNHSPGSGSVSMLASMLWAASVVDLEQSIDTSMKDSEEPGQLAILESENLAGSQHISFLCQTC